MVPKPKKYMQTFKEKYKEEFSFIGNSRKGNNFAFCLICSCDISIAHGGRNDIVVHTNKQKHKDYVKCQEGNAKISLLPPSSFKDDVIRAECLFTSFLVEHNLPISVADHAGPLFRKMFPTSAISKEYSSARTKTTAIIHEMAKHAKDDVISYLRSRPFAIATDGSNDSDEKLYPIVVMFYDDHRKKIQNCVLSCSALEGAATGRNIGQLIIETLNSFEIPVSNCVALSCDNAPVMLGSKNGVIAALREQQSNMLTAQCPCHLINLAAQKAAACLPVNLDEIVVDMYFYLKHSAKRKDSLKNFQHLCGTETKKILKHVCTRWLSLERSLTRIVDQWEPLIKFLQDEVKSTSKGTDKPSNLCRNYAKLDHCSTSDSKSKNEINKQSIHVLKSTTKKQNKQPVISSGKRKTDERLPDTSKKQKTNSKNLSRAERLFYFFTSDTSKAYSHFLLSVLPTFGKTNVLLQSDTPLVPFLLDHLKDLLKDLLLKFIKPSVFKQSTLFTLDIHKRENQKADCDLIIGNSTKKIVEELKQEERKQFFSFVRSYFETACKYILVKFPLRSEYLQHAEVARLSSISDASFSSLKFFIDLFPCMIPVSCRDESKENTLDILQHQFCKLQIEQLPFKIFEERLDVQWSLIADMRSVDGSKKFDKIAEVVLYILAIPHSNAECERVFSCVSKTRTKLRSSLSTETLEQLIVIKSRENIKCYEQTFTPQFLRKAKSATSAHLSS